MEIDRINSWALNHRHAMNLDTEELTALELAGRTANKTNEVIDKVNTLETDLQTNVTNINNQKVSKADMPTIYKLDENGNFTGTLNGKPIIETDIGLSSTVSAHEIDLNNKTKAFKSRDFNTLEIIAHRGYTDICPEHTLVAYEEAFLRGFHSWECDVQISSDGVPVLIHDTTVDRTTNGTGNVKDLTVAQLQTFDAGSDFSSFYAGVKIPTFEDFLKNARGKVRYIYPEIKGYRTQADIDIILNLIVKYGFEHNCIIQSGNYTDLDYVRERNKNITLGYLSADEPGFNLALGYAENDINAVIIAYYSIISLNPVNLENARNKGVDVIVWTVDDYVATETMKNLGTTRIMSNKLVEVV